MCDYLDRCDDEHSSLQEKFLHILFKQYGFTAQSLPVPVHGVQSMQNLKPAKEFHPLAKWGDFIADPGRYLNGIIEGEFEK